MTGPWIVGTAVPSLRPQPGLSDTRVDQPLARPYEADAAMWLARLRAEFPRWGFLFDPWRRSWIAVRGRHQIEVARTAIELRDVLHGRHPR